MGGTLRRKSKSRSPFLEKERNVGGRILISGGEELLERAKVTVVPYLQKGDFGLPK